MSSCKNGKLLDDVRRIMRMKHYSIHTERTYCDWIRQFVKFHKLQDRDSLLIASESKIEDFFSYLAIQRKGKYSDPLLFNSLIPAFSRRAKEIFVRGSEYLHAKLPLQP